MVNLVIVLILALAVGGAGAYIYKAKKRGQTCIGCPQSKTCGKSACSCCQSEKSDIER